MPGSILEKQIEKKVCDYAKSKGFFHYKFSSPGRAAVPDRIFISPTGQVCFIEFKRQGHRPTEAQWREIKRLQQQNCFVTWVDSVDKGKLVIDAINTGINLKTWNSIYANPR